MGKTEASKKIAQKISKGEAGILKSRKMPLSSRKKEIKKQIANKEIARYIKTGILGFDTLFDKGIPQGRSLLVTGGPGSGKTIFCLQILTLAALRGEKCLYLTFEEPEERLLGYMEDFGFKVKELVKRGQLKIIRKDAFALAGYIEAMLANAKGELLIDLNEILNIIPAGFIPDKIVIDSISAIATALPPKEEGYRVFIEQLFKYLESLQATSFLTSETEDSIGVVENFVADGIIALYNIKKRNVRTSALEIIKMRGTKFEKKIVPFEIKSGKGLVVYPDAEVFEEIKD